MDKKNPLPNKRNNGSWVQTERALHEAWAQFLAVKGAVSASRVMHLLLARVGDHNAVVISQKTMADILKCDIRTVRRAVKLLADHNWIDIRQIGDRGTVNAYVLNSNVAWSGPRDGIRYALFSASVVISDKEQPDRDSLDGHAPLRALPSMRHGEKQLPSGPGLPPPSEPFFDGMEPDLPTRSSQADIEDFTK